MKQEFPAIGSQWLHTNGSTYTVLLHTNVDSLRDDYVPTVVYSNALGVIYAKPLETWYRSRTLLEG